MGQSSKDLYFSLGTNELWSLYSDLAGIYRGAGKANEPRLVGVNGLRSRDFCLVKENGENFVLPKYDSGFSFSSDTEKLYGPPLGRFKFKGTVWKLPRGVSLQDGFCVNVKKGSEDHPMISVNRKMSEADVIKKFEVLASCMIKTNHVIK